MMSYPWGPPKSTESIKPKDQFSLFLFSRNWQVSKLNLGISELISKPSPLRGVRTPIPIHETEHFYLLPFIFCEHPPYIPLVTVEHKHIGLSTSNLHYIVATCVKNLSSPSVNPPSVIILPCNASNIFLLSMLFLLRKANPYPPCP